jgi:drug/metabolite transporter (DMT)-like permease
MENAIATYLPLDNGAYTNFYLLLFVSIAALVGAIWMLKQKGPREKYNQRMLIAMLLFFGALIGGSTTFFAGMKLRKTGPVHFYEKGMETPYGQLDYTTIKDARIITDKTPSYVSPNQSTRTTRLLVIEERSGKAHVLSEEDYDIQELFRFLREQVRR